MAEPQEGGRMRVTVVTAPGCHLCGDAREALRELARMFTLEVREVEAASPEGMALVARHRPALQPLVLLGEELFSVGRLPRGKLRRRLERGLG
jgi:hypothetical protein